jgi:hypothetical protein
MRKLTKELARIMKGLAFQYADDYLSATDKLKQLSINEQPVAVGVPAAVPLTTVARRRIAFVTDGKAGSPFDYVIDACQGQFAELDILLHDTHDNERFFTDRSRRAGVTSRVLHLTNAGLAALVDYIHTTPSLIYLVTSDKDMLIKQMLEQQSQSNQSLGLPLVLIAERVENRAPAVATA